MVKRTGLLAGLGLAVALLAPRAAVAQIFTPTYMSPETSSDIGVYFSDLGSLAVEGMLRRTYGNYDLGLRAALVDADDAALAVGVDFRNPIVLGTPPLKAAVTAGAQGVVGGIEEIGAQIGVTVGATFFPPEATFSVTPYLHPRFAIVSGESDDLAYEVLADIGANVDFAPNVSVRVGVSLGGSGRNSDFGIGVAIR